MGRPFYETFDIMRTTMQQGKRAIVIGASSGISPIYMEWMPAGKLAYICYERGTICPLAYAAPPFDRGAQRY